MASKSRGDNPHSGNGASPGKIFIGGLHKETSFGMFRNHFEKYGEITDAVIMRDRYTNQPRGFGFVTYADPSVVDKVIEDTHIINGKQVEIKRTIPKGQGQSKDFKTKKIFVGGIPSSVTEEEFKNFFSKYGEVVEHQIIRDHETQRSRGFGFIIFDSDEVVDEILSNGNMIEMAGTQVSLFRWSPRIQHMNQYMLIMEHASVHSLYLFIRHIFKGHYLFSFEVFNQTNSCNYLLLILGGGCYRYRTSQVRPIMVVYAAETRLTKLLYCRWRSRKLNQRNPQTHHLLLHMVATLGLVLLMMATVVLAVLMEVSMEGLVLVPTGQQVLAVDLVVDMAMVVVVVNLGVVMGVLDPVA
ncbi:hypothetical protein I3842_11G203000 [Carya illinoinensis]|uniref:RRM domain-containing protein n=1 Tax=Carya illinoinensis TaxID=32201 RepID=A0A922DT14_CARIL|nr:hypothetical protein I3842_11G203000 [Carya illinoinensis]